MKISLITIVLIRAALSAASGQLSAAGSVPYPPPNPNAGVPTVPMSCKTVLALRTNLLADLVGGLNIGIEVPVGTRYSIAADFVHAYTRIHNLYALQTIQGSLEGRYWFDPRGEGLTGWSLGVYGTYCSRFDVQWGGGVQGDGYWSAGAVAGYAITVGGRLIFEFALAGGYFFSPEIRRYDRPRDGRLIWNRTTYNVSRIALTQVRVNLAWPIYKIGKR